MATIAASAITVTGREVMGSVKVVFGKIGNYTGNYAAGGDILPAAILGLDQIDDVHFDNPGLLAGGAHSAVKYVRDANGINGKVAMHRLTTGAETTGTARPDTMRFVAFGR